MKMEEEITIKQLLDLNLRCAEKDAERIIKRLKNGEIEMARVAAESLIYELSVADMLNHTLDLSC